jgi:hypothetical protein
VICSSFFEKQFFGKSNAGEEYQLLKPRQAHQKEHSEDFKGNLDSWRKREEKKNNEFYRRLSFCCNVFLIYFFIFFSWLIFKKNLAPLTVYWCFCSKAAVLELITVFVIIISPLN